ncbi:unnamed protein product [Haemonchus placei]|uniref:Uncharacterized protein n=1 Tax=Haemonchus placei TaxID=6290 RepID=A0A0N4W8V5_HAEPC|nr:unnamed protein product [Haemonchus placei]
MHPSFPNQGRIENSISNSIDIPRSLFKVPLEVETPFLVNRRGVGMAVRPV